jgi:hypothetical protein
VPSLVILTEIHGSRSFEASTTVGGVEKGVAKGAITEYRPLTVIQRLGRVARFATVTLAFADAILIWQGLPHAKWVSAGIFGAAAVEGLIHAKQRREAAKDAPPDPR